MSLLANWMTEDRTPVAPSRSKGGSLSPSMLEDEMSVIIPTSLKSQKGDSQTGMDINPPSSLLTDSGDLESQLKKILTQGQETVEDLDEQDHASGEEEEESNEQPGIQRGISSGYGNGKRQRGRKPKNATAGGPKKAGDSATKASVGGNGNTRMKRSRHHHDRENIGSGNRSGQCHRYLTDLPARAWSG
ncbi:hypothetical protein ARMSODRAFT_1017578 [Armillaria solidipes]|uniref:Uncharacterized protein n=1 Tax=Armillaria solidipes TaxID=1076256 RepID=A0A2H3C3S5_9AGAR|nr:hypothetical protein ARMSODRAFT_1017578 [Armillaria solidipes]